LRSAFAEILCCNGYLAETAADGAEGLRLFREGAFSAVLLDMVMPGESGLEVLEKIHQHNPITPIIMVSGHGNVEIAVAATKKGAYDFLEKPVEAQRMLVTLKNAIRRGHLLVEKERLSTELQKKYSFIGQSGATKKLFGAIDKVAPTNAKVIITGETGVGKELVAFAIHQNSPRASESFVKVNCAAIPRDLIESELFGHKKGSFTGAISDYNGRFAEASSGTIFLDEIGEMEPRAQAKLLQVLQDNEVLRIGENLPQRVDVRVIAATNKNLNEEIKKGNFREDLYYRLNVAHIHIPPLRERTEDIPLLAQYYLRRFCEEYNERIMEISDTTMEILVEYEWPGNVRELKNIIERIVIFSAEVCIMPGQVMDALNMEQIYSNPQRSAQNLTEAKHNFEKNYIVKLLQKNQWRIQETADSLGIERTNLYKKMRKYQIDKPA